MTEYVYESKPVVIDQPKSMLLKVIVSGVALGFVVWALTYVLERFVLGSLLCDGDVLCVKGTAFSGSIAAVVAAIIGVATLVRMNIYRPLLIALGAVVSLWGLTKWLNGLSVLEAVGWTVLLYALAYGAYAWIARIRSVPILLITFALIVVATRAVPHFL